MSNQASIEWIEFAGGAYLKNVAETARKYTAIAKDVGSKLAHHVLTQEKANQMKKYLRKKRASSAKFAVTPKG